MKVIGLTGGIGSGKSTLLNWFQMEGIPCFESDAVGRELLNSSLRDSVILRFGADIYFDGIQSEYTSSTPINILPLGDSRVEGNRP